MKNIHSMDPLLVATQLLSDSLSRLRFFEQHQIIQEAIFFEDTKSLSYPGQWVLPIDGSEVSVL